MMQPTLIHAFADGERGGNPAGVVLDADGLDAAACQRIAAAAGVPETAFVSRSDIATLRLSFFTPTRQIAHCGHATVATFGLLHRLGRLGNGEFRKETIDGVRDVRIAAGRVFLAQTPRSIDADLVRGVALGDLLGVPAEAVVAAARVDTGNAFVQVELRDADVLAAVRPDFAAIEALSTRWGLIGLYVSTREGVVARRVASTRMFAPAYGIPEEAATGTAASGLAWWLATRGLIDDAAQIEQGRYMQPPSVSPIELQVERVGGAIHRVWVGGTIRVDDR
jgi:PhzF family phenazine biosynthesis protein